MLTELADGLGLRDALQLLGLQDWSKTQMLQSQKLVRPEMWFPRFTDWLGKAQLLSITLTNSGLS